MPLRLRLPLCLFLPPPLLLPRFSSSTMAHHVARLETVVKADEKQIEISANGDSSNGGQGAIVNRIARKRIGSLNPIYKHLGYKPSLPWPKVIETISNKTCHSFSATCDESCMMDVDKHARTSTSEFPASSLEKPEEYPSSANVDWENKPSLLFVDPGGTLAAEESQNSCSGEVSLKEEEYLDGLDYKLAFEEHSLPTCFGKYEHPNSIKPKLIKHNLKEEESLDVVDYKQGLEEHSLPTSFGKYEHPNSKKPKSIKHNLKDGSYRNQNPTNKRGFLFEVFDICHSEADDNMFLRSPIVFLDERKEPEVEKLCEEPWQILRPGMVLLKSYISNDEQVSIVRKCRKLGVAPGGFYRPGYKDGAKLRLYMMCLGLDWDPQTRKYNKRRQIDRSMPHKIPSEFHKLVDRAMRDSHDLIMSDSKVSNAEDILPRMNPDVCIVNFYTETGRLGLHQDRDESRESLTKGLPVVSFSLGDSAEFLYGDSRSVNTAEKLILESGDVLIFGGQSRHVFHGVASIIPDTSPAFLSEETGFRPGRLNLTFRQNL